MTPVHNTITPADLATLEVDMPGEAIIVQGEFESESVFDGADQFLDIQRQLELDASGQVLYLEAGSDQETIAVIEG